jgi:alkylation response protein AidB-like acyl-CoA dehydrogenase
MLGAIESLLSAVVADPSTNTFFGSGWQNSGIEIADPAEFYAAPDDTAGTRTSTSPSSTARRGADDDVLARLTSTARFDDVLAAYAHAAVADRAAACALVVGAVCERAGFAGVALGLARTTFDAFVRLASDKTPRGFSRTLRENAVIQSQVGQAEAALRSARLLLFATLGEIWTAVGRSGHMTVEQRINIRLASTFAIHRARDVVEVAYHAAGATAIFNSGPFERRLRDLHAVTQQLQGRQAHFETVGQFLLGLEPDMSWL